MPTRSVSLQDLLITPVLLWQGGNNQDPSREVEGIWPYLLLVLLCLALGTSLSLFLLLLAQTKSDQTQLDPLVQVCDPDRTTLDVPCGRLQSLEPVHDHDRVPCSSSIGNLDGLMRTMMSANLERTNAMRVRKPLARSVTTRSPGCRSKISRCSPSWQSVTLTCVSRPASKSKAVWTGQTMPLGPKHFQWVPSINKMRLTPARTSAGEKNELIASTSCKSQSSQTLAFCNRLRQSLADTSAIPSNTLHMLKC